jgi:hypothetical protein
MKSVWRCLENLLRKPPLTPLVFPTTGFEVIRDEDITEEERFEEFKTGRFCPVNVGDVFATRYQVVGKLGFGSTSTVWLARDLR